MTRFFVLLGFPAILHFVMCSICFAQIVNLDSDGTPIEISADEGIEWQQEKFVFIARGNARANRGKLTVKAHELRAYYRKLPSGATEVWRLDAIKNVRLVSDQYTAYGEHAVYDIRSKIMTMTGGNLKLVADKDWLTANEQLEYWEEKQMAVARGKAIAVREDKKIHADVLAAYFRKSVLKKTKIYRVDAFENVQISTNQDQAKSDRGVYNVESGVAVLTGSVKIKRGKNILKGCSAEVNLNTGISRLHRCPKNQPRVTGTIIPKTK